MFSDGDRDNSGRQFLIPMLHLDTGIIPKTLIYYSSNVIPSINYEVVPGDDSSVGTCRRKMFVTYAQAPIKVTSTNEDIGIYLMLGWPTSTSKKSFTTAFPVDTLGLEYFALTYCPASTTCTHTCSVAAPYDNTDIYIDGHGKHTLQQNTQYSFDSPDDLSGTYIRGNNPIAVTCGAIFNDVSDGYISIAQLPPLDSWGLKYRTVIQNSDTGILRIITADGNTVITLFEYEYEPVANDIDSDTPLTKKYTYRTVYAIFDPGEVKDIIIENNTAYDIEASKPILVAYLPSSVGSSKSFPVVLVSPADSVIETVHTTTTSSSTPSCADHSVSSAVIDGDRYFIPYMDIDGIYASRFMRVDVTSTVSLFSTIALIVLLENKTV